MDGSVKAGRNPIKGLLKLIEYVRISARHSLCWAILIHRLELIGNSLLF